MECTLVFSAWPSNSAMEACLLRWIDPVAVPRGIPQLHQLIEASILDDLVGDLQERAKVSIPPMWA